MKHRVRPPSSIQVTRLRSSTSPATRESLAEDTRDRTQDLLHAKQELYHCATALLPFSLFEGVYSSPTLDPWSILVSAVYSAWNCGELISVFHITSNLIIFRYQRGLNPPGRHACLSPKSSHCFINCCLQFSFQFMPSKWNQGMNFNSGVNQWKEYFPLFYAYAETCRILMSINHI